MIVPDEVRLNSFASRHVPAIAEADLLAVRGPTGSEPVRSAAALVSVVLAAGEISHLIFYPNLNYRREWFRLDDTIDYAFERWKRGADANDPELQNDVRFVARGHHPFTNHLMTADGTAVSWDEARDRDDLVAAVPGEIRWWTTHFGVLDPAGVNELRPIIAKWWV